MGFVDTAAREHFDTVEAWRAWLASNHGISNGIFVISWRRTTGRAAMTYDQMVEEALCFGWIDSLQSRLDTDRTMLWFSPRKRGSGWSRSNKDRVDRLVDEGRMQPAGRAVVEAARADGSWNLLDELESMEIPADLEAELSLRPPAAENFAAFSPSARRAILAWILVAKTPGTRSRRIVETAEKAARNEKANQWTRRPSA